MVDLEADQVVPKVVESALVLGVIVPGEAVPHDHVRILLLDPADHFRGGLQPIGIVPIDHQIHFRVDVPEHRPDDVPFALARLFPYDGPGFPGLFGGGVGAVVVIDVNGGVRKVFFGVGNHFGDGDGFVVARNQNGDFVHGSPPYTCSGAYQGQTLTYATMLAITKQETRPIWKTEFNLPNRGLEMPSPAWTSLPRSAPNPKRKVGM